MVNRRIVGIAIGALLVGSCGGGSDEAGGSASTAEVAADPATEAVDSIADDLQESADDSADDLAGDLAEGLEAAQEAVGGGSATFTANGQTWEFPKVLCAFGEDEIGQPGGVFNLSAIGDGLQLYASIDDSGAQHTLSLNDIKDFENPSVALSMHSLLTTLVGSSTEFLTLDGKQVSAEIKMIDGTTDQPTADTAQLTATCP